MSECFFVFFLNVIEKQRGQKRQFQVALLTLLSADVLKSLGQPPETSL